MVLFTRIPEIYHCYFVIQAQIKEIFTVCKLLEFFFFFTINYKCCCCNVFLLHIHLAWTTIIVSVTMHYQLLWISTWTFSIFFVSICLNDIHYYVLLQWAPALMDISPSGCLHCFFVLINSLSLSLCKNSRAQHLLRAEIQSLKKSWLGCKFIRVNNFFVCGPKYTNILSTNVGGIVDDEELFRFLICWSFPEIFVIKVESCQKSRKILDDFFAVTNLWGWPL